HVFLRSALKPAATLTSDLQPLTSDLPYSALRVHGRTIHGAPAGARLRKFATAFEQIATAASLPGKVIQLAATNRRARALRRALSGWRSPADSCCAMASASCSLTHLPATLSTRPAPHR